MSSKAAILRWSPTHVAAMEGGLSVGDYRSLDLLLLIKIGFAHRRADKHKHKKTYIDGTSPKD